MPDQDQDQEVRLDYILEQLAEGHLGTEEAARQIRTLAFHAKPGKTAWQHMSDAGTGDPEPPEPGSAFAISHAYTSGRISRRQYEVLAQAAADAIKAHGQAPARPQTE